MSMDFTIFVLFLIQITSAFVLFGYDVDLAKFKITREQCRGTWFYEDITVTCRFVNVEKFAVFNLSVYEEDHILHTNKKSHRVQSFAVNQVGERNLTFRICFQMFEQYPPDFEYYYQLYHNCSDIGLVSRSSTDDFVENCETGNTVYNHRYMTVPRGLEPRAPERASYENAWW